MNLGVVYEVVVVVRDEGRGTSEGTDTVALGSAGLCSTDPPQPSSARPLSKISARFIDVETIVSIKSHGKKLVSQNPWIVVD